MVRAEGIKRQSKIRRTRTARLGWRITAIIYGDAKVERKIVTTKWNDRERRVAYTIVDLFPATWHRRDCKLLPIWTNEDDTRARLVCVGFTSVRVFFSFSPTLSSCLSSSLHRAARDIRGTVRIRPDNEAKPTIRIPPFEARLAENGFHRYE